jgi:hypothetical protein
MTTVEDGRDLVHVTQAAARTFALRVTELGDEFERGFHVRYLQLQETPPDRDQFRRHPENSVSNG